MHMTSSPTPGERHPSGGSAVDRLLAGARAGIDRVQPGALASEMAAGALVVDIRPAADRGAEGELPGAVVIERIQLEWRLDPSSDHRIAEAVPDRRVIVVCNEGYASSLAADVLRHLGVSRATDLDGGYRAWRAQFDLGACRSVAGDQGLRG